MSRPLRHFLYFFAGYWLVVASFVQSNPDSYWLILSWVSHYTDKPRMANAEEFKHEPRKRINACILPLKANKNSSHIDLEKLVTKQAQLSNKVLDGDINPNNSLLTFDNKNKKRVNTIILRTGLKIDSDVSQVPSVISGEVKKLIKENETLAAEPFQADILDSNSGLLLIYAVLNKFGNRFNGHDLRVTLPSGNPEPHLKGNKAPKQSKKAIIAKGGSR